jgi:predicted O-methyltransferase YrrM
MARENLSKSEVYIQKLFAQEDADLLRVREALVADKRFGVNVGAHEGKLLQFLVGLVQPKLVVEIGVLYGYSTLWMAKALAPDAKIIALEKDEKCYKTAKNLIAQSAVAARVDLRHGDARVILETDLREIQPDFVFIDADKPGYRFYLDWAMSHVKTGGVIVGDNTFLFGHMQGEDRGERASEAAISAMTYFNETLAAAKNFRAVMIPTYEGMTIAQRL